MRKDPQTGEGIKDLPQVNVVDKKMPWLKRVLRQLGRALGSTDLPEGNGETQNGGYHLVTPNGGASPTKTAAEHPEEQVNVEELLPAIGGAGAGPYPGGSPLSTAKGLNKVRGLVDSQSGSSNGASDKEIIEQTTGTSEKTDRSGRPIDDENNVPKGKESDSIITEYTFLVDEIDRTKTVGLKKVHRSTHRGRWLSSPFKKKY